MPAFISAFGFGFDFFLGNMKQYRAEVQARRLFRPADLLKVVVLNDNPYLVAPLIEGWEPGNGKHMKMQACRRTVTPK